MASIRSRIISHRSIRHINAILRDRRQLRNNRKTRYMIYDLFERNSKSWQRQIKLKTHNKKVYINNKKIIYKGRLVHNDTKHAIFPSGVNESINIKKQQQWFRNRSIRQQKIQNNQRLQNKQWSSFKLKAFKTFSKFEYSNKVYNSRHKQRLAYRNCLNSFWNNRQFWNTFSGRLRRK